MTATILRKRSEKVFGADLLLHWTKGQLVYSKAPSSLYSQGAEGILGVSEEKMVSVGAVITLQPLSKHQVPSNKGAPHGNSRSKSMVLQESEKGNQNLSIGKSS